MCDIKILIKKRLDKSKKNSYTYSMDKKDSGVYRNPKRQIREAGKGTYLIYMLHYLLALLLVNIVKGG